MNREGENDFSIPPEAGRAEGVEGPSAYRKQPLASSAPKLAQGGGLIPTQVRPFSIPKEPNDPIH